MSEREIYPGQSDPTIGKDTDGKMTRESDRVEATPDGNHVQEKQTYSSPDGILKKKITKLFQRVKKKLGIHDQVERKVTEIKKSTSGNQIPVEDPFMKEETVTYDPYYDEGDVSDDDSSDSLYPRTDADVDFVYDFDHSTRGVAILIVYTKFTDGNSNREYAENDIQHMRKMFACLGFNVVVLKNISTAKGLITRLEEIRKNLDEDCDSFVCLMSSHGSEVSTKNKHRTHNIYTTSDVVETAKIVEVFDNDRCQQLKGKPKLFFIQACRSKFKSTPAEESDRGADIHIYKKEKHEKYEGQGMSYHTSDSALSCSHECSYDGSDPVQDKQGSSHNDDVNQLQKPSQDDFIGRDKPDLQTSAVVKNESRLDTKHSNYERKVKTHCLDFNDIPFIDDDDEIEEELTLSVAGGPLNSLQSDGRNDSYTLQMSDPRSAQEQMRLKTFEHLQKVNERLRRQRNERLVTHETLQYQQTQNMVNREQQPRTNVGRQGTRHQMSENPLRLSEEVDDVEFFDIPCTDDCLVMFSSVSEHIAWSDDYRGGWLPYCLFRVVQSLDVNEFQMDLLEVLTEVSDKMAREMETTSSKEVYDKKKSVACIYHKLTKDIYITRKPYVSSLRSTAV